MLTFPGLFHAFTTQSNFILCHLCVQPSACQAQYKSVNTTEKESIVGKRSKDLQGNRKNIKKNKIWERDVDIHVQRK